MNLTDKRWQIHPPITDDIHAKLEEYPPILRQILYNRGYTTPEEARRFIEANLPEESPLKSLSGLPEAIDRINLALRGDEMIAIYGDYDADGVTATALLVNVLRNLRANVQGYIPNRFDEGYGLNMEALQYLGSLGVKLIVTVDCGIRSLKEAEYARQIGIDLIISDHHHPFDELPLATAIINPKQPGDTYPEKDLAGVGLAYKIALGLMPHDPSIEEYLDLVALGTVADLAPLRNENRALVRMGLKYIRQPRRQGILALIGASGVDPRRISSSDIGFILGPRLNAAGRLDSALAALELLTTDDVYLAARLAQQLDNQNRERQQITREIQGMAEQIALSEDPDALLLFAAHESFNPGVVGLAASRLTEKYYKPAIVAQIGEDNTRASCRSIPEFHITRALDQCSDLLEHHGGHAAAAGFTVRNDNLKELVNRLGLIAKEQLSNLDLRPTLYADLELQLSKLKPDMLSYLEWLQPTGHGNPQAYFVSRELSISSARQVGRDGAHLKLTVTDGWITYDAIAFNQGYWYGELPASVDILYRYEMNEYNGNKTLQLNIRDIKPTET